MMSKKQPWPMQESDNYFWYYDDILGKGATGDVYKCREKKTKQEFAVKVFNGQGMSRPHDVTDRELEVLRKFEDCKHENIVKVIAMEDQKSTGHNAIVMELCIGSLHNLLEKPENAFGFEESNFKQVLFDVVSGMKYLNDQGIIHRDIKPGNILQYEKDDCSFVYKLTDFGAARELAPEQLFMSIYGTEEYLHPDLYKKGVLKENSKLKEFGANVDLWSLGATFYHVATGKLPFRPFGNPRENRRTMFEITNKKESGIISGIQKHRDGEIEWSDKLPEHTRLSPGLKEHLVGILGKLLESDSSKAMKFNELFEVVESIRVMKVIHLYSAQSGTFHMIYANPDDNFARFQELIAIQTDVGARQQDLFYNNDTFKAHSMAKVSTYPDTTEEKPIFLLGGDSMSPEKQFATSILKKTKLNSNVGLESLESDAVVSKVSAININWCLYTVRKLEQSCNLTLEVAENVITLLKRKARKYRNDAQTIQNLCHSMVAKHHACLNGCKFEMQIVETLGTDGDIPKEIIKEREELVRETEHFEKKVEELQQNMTVPVEKLRKRAESLLDGELALKWRNINKDVMNEKYSCIVQNYTVKIEEIMKNFHTRKTNKSRVSSYEMDNHRFERLRLEEYFNKAKDAMDACQKKRQTLHINLRTWLEDVYDCRSKLKVIRQEVHSFVEMFAILLESEEKWRSDHMLRMKTIIGSARAQVKRAISVSGLRSSEQPNMEIDGGYNRGDDHPSEIDLIEIDQKLAVLSSETKEAKNCLQKNTEKFQRFVEELVEGLNQNGVGEDGE